MTIAGILSAVVIGAIIGVLGRLVAPGRQKIGILWTILVGVVAALLGTVIAQKVGVATTDGIDWIELVFQIGLAAVGVVLVARAKGR